MGLDTTHGCWHGAYSAFHRWRCKIAEAAGIPLELMEGYYDGHTEVGGHEAENGLWSPAIEWARPRDGGPLCSSYHGPVLVRYIEKVDRWLPIKWDHYRHDPLHVLLDHSDCEGWIAAEDCGPLADRLESLLPLLPEEDGGGHIGPWREKTQEFIDGLRLAASRGEDVEFR